MLCARRHVCVTHGHHPRHGSFPSRHRETRLRRATVQKLSQRDPCIHDREEKIDFSFDRMEIRRQDIVVFILAVPMCSMDLGNRIYGFATATATASTDFPV